MQQPVIFIGMHRSGTTMLGRLLEDSGLFVGTIKEKNNEARYFRGLNNWLLAQSGARWDSPQAIQYLWENEQILSLAEDYIRQSANSPKAMLYLGLKRYISTRSINQLKTPWGWKDPRNTFTLPMWLRIYPEAKIICIERHGVDVAQSLRVRSQTELAEGNIKYKKHPVAYSTWLRLIQKGFTDSPRFTTLEGGFSLWQEYINQTRKITQQLPQHQILNLRYEQFLQDPLTQLRTSTEFCGLEVSEQKLKELTARINTNRAYSYQNDPELLEFAISKKEILARYGYE